MDASFCRECENLGYITLNNKRWAKSRVCRCKHPCPDCGGEGRHIGRDEQGLTFVSRCDCTLLHKRIRRFNDARIPGAYHGKSVEEFQAQTPLQKEVKHWLLAFQKRGQAGDCGILIMGNPGLGKTHLLCGVLRYLVLERGQNCRYIDSFQLLQDLKAAFESGGKSHRLMEEVSSVDILGMDELGKTRTTGWQREVLDQIISRRYDAGLTTFVTSNFGPQSAENLTQNNTRSDAQLVKMARHESLNERVGGRIYSRLMEMCKPLVIDGQDMRLELS
jgi:DNA replication protein DnaC